MKFTKLAGSLVLFSANSQTEIRFEGNRVPVHIDDVPDYVAQQIREPLLGIKTGALEELANEIDMLRIEIANRDEIIESLTKKKRTKTKPQNATQEV